MLEEITQQSASMHLEELLRIGDLFRSRGWPIEDEEASAFPSLFTRFCQMCDRLTPEQRDLMIEMTSDYQWLRRVDEEHRFFQAWKLMAAALTSDVTSIVVIPLNFWDQGNSAFAMYYLAKGLSASLRGLAGNRPITFSSGAGVRKPNAITVAVDDYVGSGTTAKDALQRLKKKNPTLVAMQVVTIAAQEAAINVLSSLGVPVFTDVRLRRGISDSSRLSVVKALKIMDSIESMLHIEAEFRRGYEQTEGIVSLQRTPNNTFPVYWTNRKVGKIPWNPPFYRNTE